MISYTEKKNFKYVKTNRIEKGYIRDFKEEDKLFFINKDRATTNIYLMIALYKYLSLLC